MNESNEELEQLIELGRIIPSVWRGWAPDEALEYLRCRLQFSQKELGQKAGLSAARVSLLEGGSDAKLSTWKRLYAAMGFELILLPVTSMTARELDVFCARGRPANYWARSRARPRRRRLRAQADRAAKEKGPEREAPGPSTDEPAA